MQGCFTLIKEYGYEYDAELDLDLWKDTKGNVTSNTLFGAICLRSGRDALKAIAREYKQCVALLPALACDSMVQPFKQYNHTVRYYKLNQDYSIDIDSIKLRDGEQVLFLYMDYFGIQSINDEMLQELKSKGNIVFIEDRTHTLIWKKNSGFIADYTMASLRKWISIPDGGLLWGNINNPLDCDTSFAEIRLKAQNMRHDYLNTGDEKKKTEYRRIFSTVSSRIDRGNPSAMSAYSYQLAKDTDFDLVRTVRRSNAKELISILKTSPFVKLIQSKSGLSDLYVAFAVPKRDVVQMRLANEGIFNTIIWPLTNEQKCFCHVAKETEENMLAAPCDQRYTIKDMHFIGEEIVRVVADVNK